MMPILLEQLALPRDPAFILKHSVDLVALVAGTYGRSDFTLSIVSGTAVDELLATLLLFFRLNKSFRVVYGTLFCS